jgi:hypothetical protein
MGFRAVLAKVWCTQSALFAVLLAMGFKFSRIVFVLCCLSASRSCPALQPEFRFQKDSVSHANHDIRDIGYTSFQQQPNSPVVTAGKGHLAFRPQWKGVISTPPYEYIRKIVSVRI